MYSCIDCRALSILFLHEVSCLTLVPNKFCDSLSTFFLPFPDFLLLPRLEFILLPPDWSCSRVVCCAKLGIGVVLSTTLATSLGHDDIKWLEYLSTNLEVLLTIDSKRWKNMRKYLLKSSWGFRPFFLSFSIWKSYVRMFLKAPMSVVIARTQVSIWIICSRTNSFYLSFISAIILEQLSIKSCCYWFSRFLVCFRCYISDLIS